MRCISLRRTAAVDPQLPLAAGGFVTPDLRPRSLHMGVPEPRVAQCR